MALLLWVLRPPLAVADPAAAPLTLPQALEMALQRNSTLGVARAQEAESYYAYRQAGALPSMVMSTNYVGGTISNVTTNNGVQDVNLQWSQNIGPIGSLRQASRVGRLGYEQAQATTRETRNTLEQNVKDAFFSMLANREQTEVSRENLQLAQKLFAVAEKRHKAGAAPRLDVVTAEIQLASSEQAVIQAEAAEKQARTGLNALLEVPATNPTEVQGSLELPALVPELPTLQRMALEARPLLLAARKAVEQAQQQVRLTRIQRNPALSATAVFDLSPVNSAGNPYYFGVTLSYPLFDYGQIGYQAERDKRAVTEKEKGLNVALVAVEAAVKTAYDNYQAAWRNASTYQQKVLAPSEKAMQMTEFGYRQGALGYPQVLTAQQTLKSARIQYVSLLLAGRQALDALEAAVGKPLAEVKP